MTQRSDRQYYSENHSDNCEVQMFSSRVCELGTKSCLLKHVINEDILIECQCGEKWWIDYAPTPYDCVGDIWRLWVNDVPGAWIDVDGNPAKPNRG